MARKLAFKEEDVLEKAMQLFWRKGYDTTSMQDLVDELGINRFSIYNTFGDKKQLFILSLKHYINTVTRLVVSPLKYEGLDAKERLKRYVKLLASLLEKDMGQLGCMLQQTGLSEVGKDAAIAEVWQTSYLKLKQSIETVVAQGKVEGSILSTETNEVLAIHLMCFLQGLIVMRKNLNSPEIVAQQADFMLQMMEAW